MPTFNITAPDGRKYRVTGDNQEGALHALRSHLGDTGGAATNKSGMFNDLIPQPQQQGSRAAGLFDDLIPQNNRSEPWQEDPITARHAAPWQNDPISEAPHRDVKTYDMGQLERALRNADAAGDTQAARTIADQIRKQRGATADGSVSANNVVRSIATGVPVIGGALNKMNAATNAALAPLLNPWLLISTEK